MRRLLLVLAFLAPAVAECQGLFRVESPPNSHGTAYYATSVRNAYTIRAWDRYKSLQANGQEDYSTQLIMIITIFRGAVPLGPPGSATRGYGPSSFLIFGDVAFNAADDTEFWSLTTVIATRPGGGPGTGTFGYGESKKKTPPFQPAVGDQAGTNVCSPAGGFGGTENQYSGGENCSSPIIIDLGDNGFQLTGASDPVTFDLLANGYPSKWSWTKGGAREGFLVLDRNGNGRIDNGAELFGNHTPLRSGATAANGYVALAEYDDDHDGAITGADAVFSRLRVWIDANHDGISQPGELHTLDELNITRIDTAYRDSRRRDRNGNLLRYWSHATTTDSRGHERAIDTCDVWFVRADP